MKKNITNKRISIKTVVSKIKQESLQNYEGNIHDHVLDIFDSLSQQEKIVFIEDVINMYSIAETRSSYEKSSIKYTNRIEDGEIINRKEDYGITEIKKTLEIENGKALIGLKDWIVKAVVISLLSFLILAGICMIALEHGLELPSSLVYFKELYYIVNPKE